MATVAETLGMAARCEGASGPDREIDAAIVLSLPACETRYLSAEHPWAYTASLDAAMGLVPEEATFGIARRVAGEGAHADIDLEFFGDAATPALALCAAALRAAAAKAREVRSS